MPNRHSLPGKRAPRIHDYRCNLPARDTLQTQELPTRADRSHENLVTIVTPTYNSAKTLSRTIDSIRLQDYPSIEYIVIDGGSSDATLSLLATRRSEIDLLLTEPDRGISDAFNKGISLASGRYIALVNSDDWLEPTHISKAVAALRATRSGFVFGDLMLHAVDGTPLYMLRGEPDYGRRISHAMPQINHPTLVCRRDIYEEHGLFDTDLSTAMDYDWLLRGYRHGVRGTHIPDLLGHMTIEGTSDVNFSRGMREVCEISVRYGYPPWLAWPKFWLRRTKTASRHIVAGWMPEKFYEWLRRRLNVHYRSIER